MNTKIKLEKIINEFLSSVKGVLPSSDSFSYAKKKAEEALRSTFLALYKNNEAKADSLTKRIIMCLESIATNSIKQLNDEKNNYNRILNTFKNDPLQNYSLRKSKTPSLELGPFTVEEQNNSTSKYGFSISTTGDLYISVISQHKQFNMGNTAYSYKLIDYCFPSFSDISTQKISSIKDDLVDIMHMISINRFDPVHEGAQFHINALDVLLNNPRIQLGNTTTSKITEEEFNLYKKYFGYYSKCPHFHFFSPKFCCGIENEILSCLEFSFSTNTRDKINFSLNERNLAILQKHNATLASKIRQAYNKQDISLITELEQLDGFKTLAPQPNAGPQAIEKAKYNQLAYLRALKGQQGNSKSFAISIDKLADYAINLADAVTPKKDGSKKDLPNPAILTCDMGMPFLAIAKGDVTFNFDAFLEKLNDSRINKSDEVKKVLEILKQERSANSIINNFRKMDAFSLSINQLQINKELDLTKKADIGRLNITIIYVLLRCFDEICKENDPKLQTVLAKLFTDGTGGGNSIVKHCESADEKSSE